MFVSTQMICESNGAEGFVFCFAHQKTFCAAAAMQLPAPQNQNKGPSKNTTQTSLLHIFTKATL
jgi:hypothetical protein